MPYMIADRAIESLRILQRELHVARHCYVVHEALKTATKIESPLAEIEADEAAGAEFKALNDKYEKLRTAAQAVVDDRISRNALAGLLAETT